MEDIGRLDIIPTKYLDDEMLARITINGTDEFSGSKFDLEKDTFNLISQEQVNSKGKQFRLFYYEIHQYISTKSAESRNFAPKDFQYYALVVVEVRDGKVYPVGNTFQYHVNIDNPERREKYLEELSEEFKVEGRERASAFDVSDNTQWW